MLQVIFLACNKQGWVLQEMHGKWAPSEEKLHDRIAHPHSEAEHGEADAVAEAGRGQEPCPGRRGGLAADVVDYQLRSLPLALSSPRPLGPALLPQCAVENHDELQTTLVQTGLWQGSQVTQHGVPLATAHPVRLVAPVQALQARVGVD